MAVVLIYEIAVPESGDTVEIAAPTENITREIASVGPLADVAPASIEDYAAIMQRPLFDQNRRPTIVSPPPPEPTQANAAQQSGKPEVKQARQHRPPPTLVLRGVALDPSGRRAVLSREDGTDYLTVGEGDDVEGWTVDEIEPDRVRLVTGDETYNLDLYPPNTNQ
ncbi:MAG: hypothetical protein GY788_05765 [bacterium]|nr:hypothetical protein [bacterium]